ncbi:vitellogenin-1-like [Cochliomyia hominivorax]
MSLRFHSPTCIESSFPLSQTERILEITEFDVNKKVVIFVSGWMSSGDSKHARNMANAFNCQGDYNFLALNTSASINTLYTWSAFNTEEIGRQLAESVEKLVKKIPIENIYLIGHSLGAQIVGYSGRYFAKFTGKQLTRITGLDPANPCFNDNNTLTGIQHDDAAFVDIIHTNPGCLGEENPLGDADFYVGGFLPIQSGCLKLGCSHTRAVEYFTESIYPGNENNFLAAYCPFDNLKKNDCDGPYKYSMGLTSPYDLKGTYYLKVNSKSPFGMNKKINNNNYAPKQCKMC